MDALRLFLAIDIPPRVRETITTLQNRFKTLGLNASWVRPENIHLTLKFLGDTSTELIPDIKQAVSNAVHSFPPFEATVREIGVFPNIKNPRVLWVGMEDPKNRLEQLQENIEDQMGPIGFPRENKKFHPHLTLARIKVERGGGRAKPDRLKREIESAPPLAAESFLVESVRLIQSRLTPRGSLYTVREDFPLGGIASVHETDNRRG